MSFLTPNISYDDALDVGARYNYPVYLYDGELIKHNISTLKKAFDIPGFEIKYAAKALSTLGILQLIKSTDIGCDVVSLNEILLAQKAGFSKKDLVFTPNMISFEEYESALPLVENINIGNLDLLEYSGIKHPETAIGIRINPHLMAGGHHKIRTGHIDSKFGISIHQLPAVKRIVNALNIKVRGIHMHNGSDILDPEVFLLGAQVLFNAAMEFEDLEYIDFGSGFKVKYFEDDIETNIIEIGSRLSEKFYEFCTNYGKKLKLIIEPGKYIVSEAGVFLVKVNIIKHTTSTVFAGVDSGFNHFIRPMFYDAHHDILNISNPGDVEKIYSVVGYICETDTFGINRKLSQVRPGDILAIKNAGAYSMVMSSNYNSRLRPAEVLKLEDQYHLLRKRETFDDLLRHQIEID